MPQYCDTEPEINSVPPPSEMKLFKPYFTIPEECTSFEVYIHVDSECYYIQGTEPGYPADGPCGNPQDLQQMILLQRNTGCKSVSKTVLSVRLDYCESPNGQKINIYVVDQADGKVKGESKSAGRIH